MSFLCPLVSSVHVVLVKSRHVFGDANTIIDALASTILSIFLDVTIVITLAVALILQTVLFFDDLNFSSSLCFDYSWPFISF